MDMWISRNCHLRSNRPLRILDPLFHHFCASLHFCFAADMRVVSRNCTEDGWSEPFPHYFDACGFEEYEYETGDQVSICCPPEGGGMGPRRLVEACVPQGPRLLMELQKLESPGSIHECLLWGQMHTGQDFHSLILGRETTVLLPELFRPPPCVHHLPGGFSRIPAFLWSSHCRVNAGPSRGPPGSSSRLKAGSVLAGQCSCTLPAFSFCAVQMDRRRRWLRGNGLGELGVVEELMAGGGDVIN